MIQWLFKIKRNARSRVSCITFCWPRDFLSLGKIVCFCVFFSFTFIDYFVLYIINNSVFISSLEEREQRRSDWYFRFSGFR